MSPIMIVLIVAACVFGVSMLLYGLFRKFTQMSWLSWQIVILFGITLLLGFVPTDLAPTLQYAIALLVLVGGVILVIGGGAAIRVAMHKKKKPAYAIFRFFDRILGAVTALLDLAVIAAVLAAAVLPVIYYGFPSFTLFDVVFNTDIWVNFFAVHAFDLVVVAIFAAALRAGWRVGFARSVVIFILIALCFGAAILSIYLTVGTSFFAKIASSIAGGISGGNRVIASAIGSAIVFLMIYLVLFILICILGYFMTKLIRNIRFHHFWGFLDGTIGTAIALVITAGLFFAVYFLVYWLSTGAASALVENLIAKLPEDNNIGSFLSGITGVFEAIEGYTSGFSTMLSTPPLSGMLYAINALIA